MIKIIELKLIKFGKFENFSIKASDGLNVIYGENEAGKSTIQLFVKAMLYGFPSRRRAGESIKERERALPWSGGKAEGILVISEDGHQIEIHRQFGKTAAGDKGEVCDSLTGARLDEYNIDNIGALLFGMPSDMFEKTVWISQNGAFMGGKDEEISKRLTNLKVSGDEEISADKALGVFDELQRKIKARDGRSAKGRQDILRQRLEECRKERFELKDRLLQTEENSKRLKLAKEELNRVTERLADDEIKYKKSLEYENIKIAAERIKQIDDYNAKCSELTKSKEYVLSKELTEAEVQTAFSAEERLNKLEGASDFHDTSELEDIYAAQRTRFGGLMALGAAALLGAVVAAIFCFSGHGVAAILTAVILFALGCVLSALGIASDRRCKKTKSEIAKKKEEEKQRLAARLKETERIKTELFNILKKYEANSAAELSRLYATALGIRERLSGFEAAVNGLLGGKSYEEIKQIAQLAEASELEASEDIEKRLQTERREQIELTRQVQELDSKMAYQVSESKLPSDIDTEIAAIKLEISELDERLAATELAAEEIRRLENERRSQITPQLNEKVNDVISAFTGGKYKDVRVAEDYRMRLSKDEKFFDAEFLSIGTYEQLYFALRLSVTELISKELPLFLDDILTSYDDKRTEAAIDFLMNKRCGQTFLFTCRGADREYAEKIGAATINIEGGI